MPRTSAAEAARTARRILEAAEARFAADGVAGAAIDDIARDAGVTRGAVYHHYGDRRELLRAVVADLHARVAARVVADAEAHEDPVAQLRAGCHAFVDAATSDETAQLLLRDAPAALGWAAWRELDAAGSERELRDALRGLVPAEQLEPLTRMLSGAMNEAALWLAERPEDPGARAAAHAGLDRVLAAVASAGPRLVT
jgi:AcrR family transcriptional regulator